MRSRFMLCPITGIREPLVTRHACAIPTLTVIWLLAGVTALMRLEVLLAAVAFVTKL
jgi:hypothetical protein